MRLALSGSVGTVRDLRWVAVVVQQQQQQVSCGLVGFLLHVNLSLAGTSADSQESPVIRLSVCRVPVDQTSSSLSQPESENSAAFSLSKKLIQRSSGSIQFFFLTSHLHFRSSARSSQLFSIVSIIRSMLFSLDTVWCVLLL